MDVDMQPKRATKLALFDEIPSGEEKTVTWEEEPNHETSLGKNGKQYSYDTNTGDEVDDPLHPPIVS